jgi:hypothetical protein
MSDKVYYWGPALTFFPDNRNVPYPDVVGSFLTNITLRNNHRDYKEDPYALAVRARDAYATRFNDLCISLVNTINDADSSHEGNDDEEKVFTEAIQSLEGEATIGGFGSKYDQFETKVNEQIRRMRGRNRNTVLEPTRNWTLVNAIELFANGDPNGWLAEGGIRDAWSIWSDVT